MERQMNAFSTKFFHAAGQVSVWDCFAQGWTGRVDAAAAFSDDRLMSTLSQEERVRIARMAAKAGDRIAAGWLAAQ